MCLCLFAIDAHEEYPFILLANRDEFRRRPAAPAQPWDDEPSITAGRDLEGMGTWLGVRENGRIGFVTNYRDPKYFDRSGPTRGKLVPDFLMSDFSAAHCLQKLAPARDFNGFNLVLKDATGTWYYSNVEGRIRQVEQGIHGLSNALLDTPWPKVRSGKTMLRQAIEMDRLDADTLFGILKDETTARPDELPNTGVGVEMERMLSPRFINTRDYGTVSSSVVLIDKDRNCHFHERRFDEDGNETDRVTHVIPLSEG